MKLKKVLAGFMAAVTAVTASVSSMGVSAGAVTEKKEYTGYGYTGYSCYEYIPGINVIGDSSKKSGIYEIGKNEYEIWENIELSDTITFYASLDNGKDYILNMRLENNLDYYINQSSKGYEKSGITVSKLIDSYNYDLHAYDYDKVYEGKNVKLSNVTSISSCKGSDIIYDEKTGDVTFVEDPLEAEPNKRFTWKITIEPGSKTNSGSKGSDISSLSFDKIGNKPYTGKAIKPSVTVKDGGKTLTKGTDYTVSYKNNTKIGTATVTITGKGDYTGTKTLTFKIVPKKTSLSINENSTEKATLSWRKSTGATGYQIYCSTNGGSYKKLATVKSADTVSKVVSKLNTEDYYYRYKVRPYTKVGGNTIYGSWSNVVTAG